jgi:hypothetical protein
MAAAEYLDAQSKHYICGAPIIWELYGIYVLATYKVTSRNF